MSDRLIRIYHRMPAPARSLAASLRGFYLRSWRYGAETEELIGAAIEREQWSDEQWRQWQSQRLSYLLHRAATRVPYYRQYWSERRLKGDRSSWEELANWPLLAKEEVREKPLSFIADDCDPRRMFHERTSGASGTPLDLWWSRETVRSWYALFEARARRWHGVTRHEPWAILGGQPVAPAAARRPPFWVWNAPMRQLYLSANHVSGQNITAYFAALEHYGVTHLITYSSSAALLAREADQLNLRAKGIKTVITNAEPLLPWQREMIRRVFGCPARETYGMAEIVAAASECAEGNLHLWPEAGWIEILRDDDDTPAAAHEAGRLVCSGLINADMPLIRYQVGDRINPATKERRCRCQRLLPLIGGIEGRTNDMLVTRDGRHVYWLNPTFYGLPVREAQIVQETVESIRVLFVPAPEFTTQTGQKIIERLHARMGDVHVGLEPVTKIPPGPRGKFQAVISKVRKG
jgi:phenylacetate-CoA ligase